jgi:hypothetical protein
MHHVLDYVEYEKRTALAELKEAVGYTEYDGKHFESVYTRFYQAWILPQKFGYDKRRMHLSSLVQSGEMTRAEALSGLREPPFTEAQFARDADYVLKKIGLTPDEFHSIMVEPVKSFWDYPSYERSFVVRLRRKILRYLGRAP